MKSAKDSAKIMAEASWFAALPPPLRAHVPAFLGVRETANGPGYALEYLYLPTLADLHVFGRLSTGAWTRIFDACDEFLGACASYPAPDTAAEHATGLYLDKAPQRLARFAREAGVSITAPCRFNGRALPSLLRMAEIAAQAIPPADPTSHLHLMHGDFCFSNILYDARASLVRVIDPRGVAADGTVTPYGDIRYDLAKLYHSVVGRYDHILAGYYRLTKDGPTDVTLELRNEKALRDIEALFMARPFAGMLPLESASHAICILLFLSMLPLHADDIRRQCALMANAMRLFSTLDAGGTIA